MATKTPMELMMEQVAARRKTPGAPGPDVVLCKAGLLVKIVRDENGNPFGYAVRFGVSKETFLTPAVLNAAMQVVAADIEGIGKAWSRTPNVDEIATLRIRKAASQERREEFRAIRAVAKGHGPVKQLVSAGVTLPGA
jgi:hypothetical protein